ncbi:MAG: hypothetical protein ACKV2T_00350 [Kofleriaceae bacterium]
MCATDAGSSPPRENWTAFCGTFHPAVGDSSVLACAAKSTNVMRAIGVCSS